MVTATTTLTRHHHRDKTLHQCPYRCRDVEDDNGDLGTPVVHRSEAVVSLLSCCVPDLELHRCIVQTNRLSEECSYSRDKRTSNHGTTTTTMGNNDNQDNDDYTQIKPVYTIFYKRLSTMPALISIFTIHSYLLLSCNVIGFYLRALISFYQAFLSIFTVP